MHVTGFEPAPSRNCPSALTDTLKLMILIIMFNDFNYNDFNYNVYNYVFFVIL